VAARALCARMAGYVLGVDAKPITLIPRRTADMAPQPLSTTTTERDAECPLEAATLGDRLAKARHRGI